MATWRSERTRGRPYAAPLAFLLVLAGLEIALEAWRATQWPADFGAPYALTARLLLQGHTL